MQLNLVLDKWVHNIKLHNYLMIQIKSWPCYVIMPIDPCLMNKN